MKKSILAAIVLLIITVALFIWFAKSTSVAINVSRTFNAPPEKVWALWTDAEAMKNWWSPTHYTAPVIQNDVRVGGKFLFSMKSPEGQMSWNTGTYTEVIPQQKLVQKMSFSDENGNPVPASHYGLPGEWPDTVTVTAEFETINGKTYVKIRETGIPMIMSLFAKMGWEQQFDKFEKLVAPEAH